MKKLMTMILALNFTNSFAADKMKPETYKLNPSTTSVEWVGTKVTGEHRGFVKIKEGSQIELKGGEISQGSITVDLNSLTVTDIQDPEYVTKFIGHMKSSDFFNTEKYPEAKLDITKSTTTKEGLAIEGKMTILGKTQPVKFTAKTLKKTDSSLSSEAVVKIDRTKFGLKYGSGQFFKGLGDKMIHDEFTLNIKLEASKI
jgi:polyisoprenoid-binding protein YceI